MPVILNQIAGPVDLLHLKCTLSLYTKCIISQLLLCFVFSDGDKPSKNPT